jgi:ABC-type transport system substrate-binding protein
MFSKAKNVTAVVILVLVSAFAGVLAVHAEEEVTVVYGQSISLTDLDPAYGAYLNYPAGYEAAYCIYDGLVTFDENLNIVPALATSWEVSEDKLALLLQKENQTHSSLLYSFLLPFYIPPILFYTGSDWIDNIGLQTQ